MATGTKVSAVSTWSRIGGCELDQAIEIQIKHEELFYKPALEEILHEERAVLLAAISGQDPTACELQLKIYPEFKFSSVHLLCSAPKVELFLGSLREYNETVYGTVIESDDDEKGMMEEANNDECKIRSYRYDMEITKSGVVDMTLKMLSTDSEVCIFGLLILIAPNPNGVTTLLPSACIDLDNVNEMLRLSKQKLSPNAEKCKLFMEMYSKSKLSNNNSNCSPTALLDQMKHMMATNTIHPHTQETDHTSHIKNTEIEKYIDTKLNELEIRLSARIDNFQALQNAKLDAILQRLEELKK